MSDPLAPLLGSALVLVAHPDDESIGCGGLLQRMRAPVVVFATDGGPLESSFWKGCASREAYVQLREQEKNVALNHLGITGWQRLAAGGSAIADQQLFRNLPDALDSLLQIAAEHDAQCILTHAYEGGHPDHDACSFLAARAATQLRIPVWEFPLYHRANGTAPSFQVFIGNGGTPLQLTQAELSRKAAALSAYASQGDFLRGFDPAVERFRVQLEHDFLHPAHSGRLNYEAWNWPMTGRDVCAAFAEMLT